MSICSYNKNIKPNATNTPTSSNNKSLKDERPGTNFPSKGPARRQPQFEGKKGPSYHSQPKNRKHQRIDNSKNNQRFEKYAPGGSYVGSDGKVKEGSKKVSLNHLLNFKFEPRQNEELTTSHWHKGKRSGHRRISTNSVYSKERFLQANCQFIVAENGDYSINATDPDAPVPWDKIEQVQFLVENELSCPICLYPPTVPKITKCGHIYCWPCILHYLALDEKGKSVRECPICNVDVRKRDLRSVSLFETIPRQAGINVKMNLMFRDSTSLTPQPIEEIDTFDYSGESKNNKITEYSPNQVLEFIIEPELEALKCKLALELDDFEREFFNCAILDCEARQAEVLQHLTEHPPNKINSGADLHEDASKVEEQIKLDSSKDVSDATSFYFYQIEGGENIFLDGINVKCLLKEYSHFKQCPASFEATIVHMESFTMTEELRKRHKYLSHLPLSCEYKIAELDLEPPLISQETLDEFQDLIKKRMKSRQKKERQENDSRRRAEIEEQRKMKEYVRSHSYHYIPSEMIAVNKVDECSALQSSNVSVEVVSSSSSDYSLSPPQNSASMSFAEKLRTGEVTTARSWMKKAPSAPSHIASAANLPFDDPDNDDDPYYHAPTYQSSFGDALSAALDGLHSTSMGGNEASAETGTTSKRRGKKQKKKAKQTLLFTTSAPMHN